MASQPWHAERPLIQRLAEEPFRFEFCQAVKLLELLAARSRHALRSLGEGHTPAHEALRVKARSSFAFPASDLDDLKLPPATLEVPALLESLAAELPTFLRSRSPATLTSPAPEPMPVAPGIPPDPNLWPLQRLAELLQQERRPDPHTRGELWHEWQATLRRAQKALNDLHPFPHEDPTAAAPPTQESPSGGGLRLRAALTRLETLLQTSDLPVLVINFLSLAGALGPLPHAYSELLLPRTARGNAASDFLDIFHHRLASLMFRVRKHFTIGLSAKPPNQDHLARRLAAFAGAPPGAGSTLAGLPVARLLPSAGLVAWQPHSAALVERCLGNYFARPISVVPATGGWLHLEPEQQTRLGRAGANQILGRSATLGTRAWDQQSRFTLRLGPLSATAFEDFLPTGTAYAPLCALTRFLVGPELDFHLELELGHGEPLTPRLGRADRPRLGWTTWLGPSPPAVGPRECRRVCLRGDPAEFPHQAPPQARPSPNEPSPP
jgi:type VI secretion system protein ImpH